MLAFCTAWFMHCFAALLPASYLHCWLAAPKPHTSTWVALKQQTIAASTFCWCTAAMHCCIQVKLHRCFQFAFLSYTALLKVRPLLKLLRLCTAAFLQCSSVNAASLLLPACTATFLQCPAHNAASLLQPLSTAAFLLCPAVSAVSLLLPFSTAAFLHCTAVNAAPLVLPFDTAAFLHCTADNAASVLLPLKTGLDST